MIIRLLLLFLFCSISPISHAGSCEERVFSGYGAILAFVKSRQGKFWEWKMGLPWASALRESTIGWSHEEAILFLSALVSRIGIDKTLERLKYNYEDLAKMEFRDFMQKISFYDEISPEVAIRSLSYSFAGFNEQGTLHKTINKESIKKTYHLIKKFIGKEGAIHLLMTEPKIFEQARYEEISQVLPFVEQYTRSQKTTPSLERRLQMYFPIRLIHFRQALMRYLSFDVFVPLDHFSWKQPLSRDQAILKDRARFLQSEITVLFLSLSNSSFSYLTRVVDILETLLPQKQVSEIMTQHREIFKANPHHIHQNIQILKETLNQRETSSHLDVPLESVIADIIRGDPGAFFQSRPAVLKETIALMKKHLGLEKLLSLMTNPTHENNFNSFLFQLDPIKLKTVETALIPYFEPKDIGLLIEDNFREITQIDHIYFEKVLKTLALYMERKDITEQIALMFSKNQLADGLIMEDLSIIYGELNNFKNHFNSDQIKVWLNQNSILDLDLISSERSDLKSGTL